MSLPKGAADTALSPAPINVRPTATAASNSPASEPSPQPSPTVGTRGRHVLVELHGCDPQRLNELDGVLNTLKAAAERIGATIVNEASHRYTPQGVTALLLIAESHLSIHTWPEEGYAAADLYTCGQLDPRPAVAEIEQRLMASRCELWEVARGAGPLALRPSDGSAPRS